MTLRELVTQKADSLCGAGLAIKHISNLLGADAQDHELSADEAYGLTLALLQLGEQVYQIGLDFSEPINAD